jgi:phage portal protein BeeE
MRLIHPKSFFTPYFLISFQIDDLSDQFIIDWLANRKQQEEQQLKQTARRLQIQFDEINLSSKQREILEKHYSEFGITSTTLRFLSNKAIKKVF